MVLTEFQFCKCVTKQGSSSRTNQLSIVWEVDKNVLSASRHLHLGVEISATEKNNIWLLANLLNWHFNAIKMKYL